MTPLRGDHDASLVFEPCARIEALRSIMPNAARLIWREFSVSPAHRESQRQSEICGQIVDKRYRCPEISHTSTTVRLLVNRTERASTFPNVAVTANCQQQPRITPRALSLSKALTQLMDQKTGSRTASISQPLLRTLVASHSLLARALEDCREALATTDAHRLEQISPSRAHKVT